MMFWVDFGEFRFQKNLSNKMCFFCSSAGFHDLQLIGYIISPAKKKVLPFGLTKSARPDLETLLRGP